MLAGMVPLPVLPAKAPLLDSHISSPKPLSSHTYAILPRPSTLLNAAPSVTPLDSIANHANSFVFHTYAICTHNSFPCHTSKNTGFKVFCLPHFQEYGGTACQMLTRNPTKDFYPERASRVEGSANPRFMRLFATLARIPTSMIATTSCTSTARLASFFSSTMSEEARSIAHGLRRRDPDLLDRLIEQYQFRLFRYLYYICGDRERAEDFFQETWIRVLERGHQYDGKSKFEAWLFAIARHLVIDWQRQKKMQSLDALLDSTQESPMQFPDEKVPSALHQVLAREDEAAVHTSLGKIAAIYREVLVLRFQEELQIEEMATVLSVNVSTVKSRLYRGLEAMRTVLQEGAS